MTKRATNLGELKSTNYSSISVREELRKNLIEGLKEKKNLFPGIQGFDDTVIPDLQRAILSRHSILLLGLRGQAKTRIARMLLNLLDEYIPAIKGVELMDDPLNPISREGIDLIEEHGDETPIEWIHRSQRYVEKLATPDVSVADLIGDVDPIKAATLKLPYSDERVIHFGLIPRAHRSIFVINELPDLQARIQVALFNILEEGDIQIRGFKLRLPLDIQFLFTANPEDYTNRGSIITPLKDRIESQILTHYPRTLEISRSITKQEAKLAEDQKTISIEPLHRDLLERIALTARKSEYVDEKSGVSTRLTISGMENFVSSAERRMLINGDKKTQTRISDFWGVIPSITGKVELVYEGEQEGAYSVALKLMDEAIKETFLTFFPNPEKLEKNDQQKDPYGVLRAWFSGGNMVDLRNDLSNKEFSNALKSVSGIERVISKTNNEAGNSPEALMELCLHGLAAFTIINKEILDDALQFNDMLANMFDDLEDLGGL